MKKVISILVVLIVLVGAVFAADGDKVVVNAKVAEHVPGFKIFGGMAADALGTEGSANGGTISTNKDISLEPITVYFKLTQYSPNATDEYTGTKAKFRGTATLTVTAAPLSTKIGETTFQTAAPACMSATAKSISGIDFTPAASTGSDSVVFTLVYDGRSIQDQDVATFSFKWTEKDELPPATTYSADVVLTYSVQ